MAKNRAAVFLVLFVLLSAGCGSGSDSTSGPAPTSLVFAATPSGEARTFDDDYGPFVKAMSKEAGVTMRTFQAADYAGVIEGLIAGTVDVAQLGAFSYALAEQNGAKIEPVGVRIHSKGDTAGYTIYAVAPTASRVSALGDFRNMTICFPDPASTTTLVPLFELTKAGLTDKSYKRLTVPAGATIPRTVKNGDCDLGFASQAQLENAIRKNDVGAGDLKVVWETRAPGSPLVVRTDLPADLRSRVRDATNRINAEFLEQNGYCTGTGCPISASGDYGFIPIEDSYYDVITEACRATRIESCGPIGT